MQINTNAQVGVDVLKKAIQINQNQVNNLLNMEQNAQNKIQAQTQKTDTVPKSNIVGSLFDKKA